MRERARESLGLALTLVYWGAFVFVTAFAVRLAW